MLMLISQPFNSLEVVRLPCFVPNEHLFTKHKELGTERWEVFANAVRNCMADAMNFPKSTQSVPEKFAYL